MFHVFTDACRKNDNSNICNPKYPAKVRVQWVDTLGRVIGNVLLNINDI